MSTSSPIRRILMAAGLALAMAACGDDVTPGSDGGGGAGPCPAGDVFCHAHGGDRWTDERASVTFSEATAYCESLGGTLPGISALRTLFVACPATEPGGACGVTDQCTSETCLTEACVGCGDGGLNVFQNENPFWSSTANSDKAGERFVAVYRYSLVHSVAETVTQSAYCIAPP